MAHAPENGCAGQERGQEAGSGQAQARAPCQAAPPGVGVRCEAWEKGSTRPSLESSPPRRPYESTPQDEVQTTTGPGPQRPAHPSTFSVCPALPARPNSQVPKCTSSFSTPGPVQAAPGPEHLISTSSDFLAPPPPPGLSSPFPSPPGWVRHPLWAHTGPWAPPARPSPEHCWRWVCLPTARRPWPRGQG